jgi:hypothetical protein
MMTKTLAPNLRLGAGAGECTDKREINCNSSNNTSEANKQMECMKDRGKSIVCFIVDVMGVTRDEWLGEDE